MKKGNIKAETSIYIEQLHNVMVMTTIIAMILRQFPKLIMISAT